MKTIVKKILHYLSQRDFGEIILSLTLLLIALSMIMLYGCKGSPIEPEPTPKTSDTLVTLVSQKTIQMRSSVITFDSVGHLWCAQQNGDLIEIAPDGTMKSYSILWDQHGGIAIANRNIYITNITSSTLTELAPDGTSSWLNLGFGKYPSPIVSDGNNVYIAEELKNGGVIKIAPDGTMKDYAIGHGFPQQIMYDGTNVWTLNGDSTVTKIATDGTIKSYAIGFFPRWAQCNNEGLWIMTMTEIEIFDENGIVKNHHYLPEPPAGMAFLKKIKAVVITSAFTDNIYIVDMSTWKILLIINGNNSSNIARLAIFTNGDNSIIAYSSEYGITEIVINYKIVNN